MSEAPVQRVVIISGAGKGLGKAYAHYLAERGVAVVVNNRRHDRDVEASADAVVREIRSCRRQRGGALRRRRGSRHGRVACSQLALEQFGRLDAVIANAGVSEAATFCKQDAASITHNVTINLLGTAYLLLPTFRHLYAQGAGHVVLSTSAAGLYGEHGLPAYSAAKAGLIGLMHSLAQEGRSHRVFVNAIAPFARTQMTEESAQCGADTGARAGGGRAGGRRPRGRRLRAQRRGVDRRRRAARPRRDALQRGPSGHGFARQRAERCSGSCCRITRGA